MRNFRAMGATDVFLLTGGPQQVVNALEARGRFKVRGGLLLGTPRVFQLGIEDFGPWCHASQVVFVRRTGRLGRKAGTLAFESRLRTILRTVSVSRLFIGHYGEAFRSVAHWLSPNEVILLDDGTASIEMAARRKRDLEEFHAPSLTRSLSMHLGRNTGHIEGITFFSAYSPALTPGDQLVTNDYRWVRSTAVRSRPRKQVDFLGHGQWMNGDMEPVRYWTAVRRAAARTGLPVQYLCRGSEPVEDVRTWLMGSGIEVVSATLPYELHLAAVGAPEVVMGFTSSALVTAARIADEGTRVVSHVIPEEFIVSGAARRGILQGIYGTLRLTPGVFVEPVDHALWV